MPRESDIEFYNNDHKSKSRLFEKLILNNFSKTNNIYNSCFMATYKEYNKKRLIRCLNSKKSVSHEDYNYTGLFYKDTAQISEDYPEDDDNDNIDDEDQC